MSDPHLAEDLASEATLELLVDAVVLGVWAVGVAAVLEGVRRRSQPYDRAS